MSGRFFASCCTCINKNANKREGVPETPLGLINHFPNSPAISKTCIILGMKKGFAFLTRKNIADSTIGGMGFALFMLLVALVCSLPISWGLAVIYFLIAFCFAFLVGLLNSIVDKFLKEYFPEFHEKAAEFKKV